MRVSASAPSNIALIKYMGKKDHNIPSNVSFSYTLENFRSYVVLERSGESDRVCELDHLDDFTNSRYPLEKVKFKESETEKYLKFFKFLKNKFNIEDNYKILSANDFPLSCGLASSASSFAALTLASYNLAQKLNSSMQLSREELSSLSRQGSGSSCRSFFSPWSLWQNENASQYDLKSLQLFHSVIVINSEAKKVSSSEAHKRIESSLLSQGRSQRAELRLNQLLEALKGNKWEKAFELCWAEFWDMHALFHTSQPPFYYMNEKSLRALNLLHNFWAENKNGPLVTMDAGPNIHLLWKDKDQSLIHQLKSILIKEDFKILERP